MLVNDSWSDTGQLLHFLPTIFHFLSITLIMCFKNFNAITHHRNLMFFLLQIFQSNKIINLAHLILVWVFRGIHID